MTQIHKVCLDRKQLPKANTYKERLIMLDPYKWPRGHIIRALFVDGDSRLHEKVKHYAVIWLEHANLDIVFVDDRPADIRISFKQDGTSWSAIGADCQSIDANQPTMNFGWLTPESEEDEISGVVLHEFGHALGCAHEHMSPAAGIQWNKPAVYNHYASLNPPWSKQMVDDNIFNTYSTTQTSHTPFDPTSIMMYPIPKEHTLNGFEVGWNNTLSAGDQAFIRKEYP